MGRGKGRANGEGSIDWVESRERYRARVSLPDGTRKAVYGRTRAEVGAKLTELLKAAKDHLPIPSEQLTVNGYLDEWFTTHGAKVRATTADRYRGLLDKHVRPVIGRLRLARLEPRDLNRLFSKMLADGLSPSTVRQARAILGRALRDAERSGMVSRNVARLTDAPRVEREEMRCFDAEQARRFVEAAQGERLGALFVLAVSHGLRMGELLGLCWPDLDLEAGTLTVRHQLQRILPQAGSEEPQVWVLTAPKTSRSRRVVSLSALATSALRAHRVRQAEERLSAGGAWDTSWNLVFANTIGRPLNPSNLTQKDFLPLLKRAELPRIRFHDLRHTCATLLLRQGEQPHVVSRTLGHQHVSMTLGTYAHVLPDQRDQVARAVDAIFTDAR